MSKLPMARIRHLLKCHKPTQAAVRDRASHWVKSMRSGAGDVADLDTFEGAEKSEYLKQIDDHCDHNNRIQDAFDFAVHGNVSVHEPEKHSDNDQHTDDINKRH